MMRLLTLLMFLVAAATAQAEVYKWKDANGNLIFSDTPHDGAEVVELGPTTVVPGEPPAKPANSQSEGAPAANQPASYQSIVVVAPGDDETLRNQQAVAVDVAVEPALMVELGHRVVLYVDGTAFGEPTDSPHFALPGMARGSHQLAAAVVDAQGNELIRSNSVVFHLHQNSVADPKTGKSQPPSLPVPPKAK